MASNSTASKAFHAAARKITVIGMVWSEKNSVTTSVFDFSGGHGDPYAGHRGGPSPSPSPTQDAALPKPVLTVGF